MKEIQENSKKEIAVYELGTQASIQVIEQEISEARQATKRLVDEIEISSTVRRCSTINKCVLRRVFLVYYRLNLFPSGL